MNTILDEIKKLKNYDYYRRENEAIRIEDIDWSCQQSHAKFIEKYLNLGRKKEILEHFDFDLIKFDRATHTNSVFFLGCLLYDKLKLKVKIKFYRSDNRDEFQFIWFLTSLVHDFGYKVEQDKDNFPQITKEVNSIEVTHNLFYYKNTSDEELKLAYDRYENNTKKLLDNISIYYEKRFNGRDGKKGKIDHGIYAGLKLFDALVKNRIIRKEQNDDDLYWGKELEEFYAVASFSIAIHNIRRDEKIEQTKPLKFSIDKEPFIFLFGLADTIEPTKTFDDYYSKYVLENIMIDFDDDKTIIIKNKEGSKLDFSILQKKIMNLENWLDLEVCICGNTKIVININKDILNG